MSLWNRVRNVFRGDDLNRELDEEIESHLAEATSEGRDVGEARRAFGNALLIRERSRDAKLSAWLDSLRADALFGWRQLAKNRAASAAAILSLALAVGACVSAFRLIDAVLLRPLPVADPAGLFVLKYAMPGEDRTGDGFEYPLFRELRAAAGDDAELFAIAGSRTDVRFGADRGFEKARLQHVSGNTLSAFGLRPQLGRLLTPDDDRTPGAHRVAVLSHHYWTSRFGQDREVIGRTFELGGEPYEIVGVLEPGFTGTNPGSITGIFVPTMAQAKLINDSNWAWLQIWVRLRHGAATAPVSDRLQTPFSAFRSERVKASKQEQTKKQVDEYVAAALSLTPAGSGVSFLQRQYRQSLLILGVIAGLVLLIACANVANLLSAQAAARAREMALRVSIGAGRARLVQLVMIESAMIAVAAMILGGLFAWWSAPFVVSQLNPPDNPVELILRFDWRVAAFSGALTLAIAILFGLAPAFRASAVEPSSALKGGENPHRRSRLMNSLVAAQVAFCFLVHMVAGLFVGTFDRLVSQPTGFDAKGLLIANVNARDKVSLSRWQEVEDRLRELPGVTAAGVSRWPLMSDYIGRSQVWVAGKRPKDESPLFLEVSPGWFETMRIPFEDGGAFRRPQSNGVVVNHRFASEYLPGRAAAGSVFERRINNRMTPFEVMGVTGEVRYRGMRDGFEPTMFVPFGESDWGSFIVRVAGENPLALASKLREEIPRIGPEFRVSNITTQQAIVESHTIRERLLAMISAFFGAVALVLAAVGLFGVLSYAVVQRTREIGIRMALGARAEHVARKVTTEVFAMLILGSVAGLGAGLAAERYIEKLLYQVKATDATMLALPVATIFLAALLAALPPVLRAVRIDPATALRSE